MQDAFGVGQIMEELLSLEGETYYLSSLHNSCFSIFANFKISILVSILDFHFL